MKKDIFDYIDDFKLVDLSEGYRIDDFNCEIYEYGDFLHNFALIFQEAEVSKTHLLINKANADIIAYMVLVADSIKLSSNEKERHDMDFIPFEAIPAIKIGKLAVDDNYNVKYRGIGTLMIELARGIAQEVVEKGVACKFITVDADTVNNPTVVEFYQKNGFSFNEKYSRKTTVSMRLDIFKDISSEQLGAYDVEA